jgi:ribosomal protein L40E
MIESVLGLGEKGGAMTATCVNGHELQGVDSFCTTCGGARYEESVCNKCQNMFRENANFCFHCGTQRVKPKQQLVFQSGYGRNHDIIAQAVRDDEGKTLTTGQIIERVLREDPDFNIRSLLPNDHGQGSMSSCRCSMANESRPIFWKVGYGHYLVVNGDPKKFQEATDYFNSPSQGVLVSKWLRENAVREINNQNLNRNAKVLQGSKGGRFVTVGIQLPELVVTQGYETFWSIGVDCYKDSPLGETAPGTGLFLGLQCDRVLSENVRLPIFRLVSQALPDFDWEVAEQNWVIKLWFNPPNKGDEPVNLDVNRAQIIKKFTQTYKKISQHFESLKDEESADNLMIRRDL